MAVPLAGMFLPALAKVGAVKLPLLLRAAGITAGAAPGLLRGDLGAAVTGGALGGVGTYSMPGAEADAGPGEGSGVGGLIGGAGAGGAAGGDSEIALRSQIPGKAVSFPVEEGATVKKGDPIVVLESKFSLASRKCLSIVGTDRFIIIEVSKMDFPFEIQCRASLCLLVSLPLMGSKLKCTYGSCQR